MKVRNIVHQYDPSVFDFLADINPLKNQNQNQRYECLMAFPGYEVSRVGFPAPYQGTCRIPSGKQNDYSLPIRGVVKRIEV